MIVKKFRVNGPPYLIEGVGVNPDYRKVEAELENRFYIRYRNRMIDSWSLSDLRGMTIALDLNEAFVIMTNEGTANRSAIIVANSEEKMNKAKSELENLFD